LAIYRISMGRIWEKCGKYLTQLGKLNKKESISEVHKDDKAQVDQKVQFNPRSSSALAIALPALYILVLTIFCLNYSVIPGPEFLVLCFFIYAAYNKRSKRFVKDWIPFVTLFISYQAMYGVVGAVAGIVHVSEPITAELQLFGSIPTVMLQQLYRMPVLDYLGAFFYSIHFFAPTIFAFLLWRTDQKDYSKYTVALVILTYSALKRKGVAYPGFSLWGVVQRRVSGRTLRCRRNRRNCVRNRCLHSHGKTYSMHPIQTPETIKAAALNFNPHTHVYTYVYEREGLGLGLKF